jgi:hypothetical protein
MKEVNEIQEEAKALTDYIKKSIAAYKPEVGVIGVE